MKPDAALAIPAARASGGVSAVVWVMLLLSAVFVIVAAIPSQVTYRLSTPLGRTMEAARLPLLASAVAVTIGVAVSLLVGNA